MNLDPVASRCVVVVRQQPRYDPDLVASSVHRAIKALGVSWSDMVRPGDRVLLKPNFIRERRTDGPDEWEQIITHGTVIAAVAREAAAAMDEAGTAHNRRGCAAN